VHNAVELVSLVVGVTIVAGTARRFGISAPVVLVVAGLLASFVPGVPSYTIDPDVVLLGLLPPLLYAAALRTSLVDIRANRQALGLLAVGAVVLTTLAVGWAAWLVVPGLTAPAALALGAVVAPPDAVAATSIARRAGLPRRLVSLLEGESLLNDATALVALRASTAAIIASVGLWSVVGRFVLAAGGGIIVGFAMAWVLAVVRRHVQDPVLDTSLSLAAPFLAYLPAEAVGASGVLAVVIVAIILGHKSPVLQSAASRLSEQTYWRTVQFVLENVVFALIGLQVRDIVSAALDSSLGTGRLVFVCAVVLVTTIAVRVAWVFLAAAAYRFGTRAMRSAAWSWPYATVVSWTGIRGVVTLAAAFVLPVETPQRPVLVLAALVVVGGTLLVQGLTLPVLVRRVHLPGPDAARDALQEAALLSRAARAGIARLEELRADGDDPDVIGRLERGATNRANAAWERFGRGSQSGETPSEAYRRLRLEMLRAEKAVVLDARDTGSADDDVLREVLKVLDTEESTLDRLVDRSLEADREVASSGMGEALCSHLDESPQAMRPRTPDGCESCLEQGTRWVHLRLCLTCGRVGCCDSSPEHHADRHYDETGHPVMRSFEPGESWRWCYPDQLLG
jgi:CPA1 family monovalent cation:H+ antiporter